MKSGEDINWEQFGPTPRYLAAGLGIRPELILAYFSGTLGGLAGPFARMGGFLGESHSPALPMILTVKHPGRARHLEQLAVEPATHFNDWQRRQSQAVFPEWFEKHHEFQGSKTRQEHLELMGKLDGAYGDGDQIARKRTSLLRHRQNYQPSVMLTAPNPKSYVEARASVFDESPLIVDTGGTLIRNAIQPHPQQKDWQQLLSTIIEGARGGTDQTTCPNGLPTLNSISRTRTPFVMHLPAELTSMVLTHPASANLFEVAVLLPTARVDAKLIPSSPNFATAKQMLGRYRAAMNRVLWSRLDNSGVAFTLTLPIPELITGSDKIEDRLDNLPPEIRRYCGGLYDLPMRILWTALVLDDPKAENVQSLILGVLQTARWCVEEQVVMIKDALEQEERRQLQITAAIMLRKLGELALPCRLADLQRKYHKQRKGLLEPTLSFLCQEELVDWDREQNRIALLEKDSRPDWLECSPGSGKSLIEPLHSSSVP